MEEPKLKTKPAQGLIDDATFAICGVCGGEHDCGFGYAPSQKQTILWTCQECLPVAEKTYGAPAIIRSRFAQVARDHALVELGGYLEHIGKSDFYEFTQDEARAMADLIMKTWQDKMREQFTLNDPPF